MTNIIIYENTGVVLLTIIENEEIAFSQTITNNFVNILTSDDRKDIEWLIEEYPYLPNNISKKNPDFIALRLVEIGKELYQLAFNNGPTISGKVNKLVLNSTNLIFASSNRLFHEIPWELLYSSNSNLPLFLNVKSFSRTFKNYIPTKYLTVHASPLKLLIVISRSKELDIDYTLISLPLFNIIERTQVDIHVDVLRPPTLLNLKETLYSAKESGFPYHIVHFDTHGSFGAMFQGREPKVYIHLENELGGIDITPIKTIGSVLSQAAVQLVFFNACRSGRVSSITSLESSIASVIIKSGVKAVIGMSYSISSETAMDFIISFYYSLFNEKTVGESLNQARSDLYTKYSQIRYRFDWIIPVHYYSSPLKFSVKKVVDSIQKDRIIHKYFSLHNSLSDKLIRKLEHAFYHSNLVLFTTTYGEKIEEYANAYIRWHRYTSFSLKNQYISISKTTISKFYVNFDSRYLVEKVLLASQREEIIEYTSNNLSNKVRNCQIFVFINLSELTTRLAKQYFNQSQLTLMIKSIFDDLASKFLGSNFILFIGVHGEIQLELPWRIVTIPPLSIKEINRLIGEQDLSLNSDEVNYVFRGNRILWNGLIKKTKKEEVSLTLEECSKFYSFAIRNSEVFIKIINKLLGYELNINHKDLMILSVPFFLTPISSPQLANILSRTALIPSIQKITYENWKNLFEIARTIGILNLNFGDTYEINPLISILFRYHLSQDLDNADKINIDNFLNAQLICFVSFTFHLSDEYNKGQITYSEYSITNYSPVIKLVLLESFNRNDFVAIKKITRVLFLAGQLFKDSKIMNHLDRLNQKFMGEVNSGNIHDIEKIDFFIGSIITHSIYYKELGNLKKSNDLLLWADKFMQNCNQEIIVKHHMPIILHEIGILRSRQGNLKEANRFLKKSLALEDKKNYGNRAKSFFMLGQIAIQKGKLSLGIKRFKTAYKCSKKIGDKLGEIECLDMLVMYLSADNQIKKAESYMKILNKKVRKSGNIQKRISVLEHMARLKMQKGENEIALKLQNKALYLSISEGNSDISPNSSIFYNTGVMYAQIGDYENARIYLTKTLEVARFSGSKQDYILALHELGIILFHEGHLLESKKHLLSVIEQSDNDFMSRVSAAQLCLQEIKEENYLSAFAFLTKALENCNEDKSSFVKSLYSFGKEISVKIGKKSFYELITDEQNGIPNWYRNRFLEKQ